MQTKSKQNFTECLDAIFKPETIKLDYGIKVYPLTLAHYSLLEKVGSFVITGTQPTNDIEIYKTMYICCHESKEVYENLESIDEKALEFADNLPPYMMAPIVSAITDQIKLMIDLIPTDGEDKKKLNPTAGFQA